MNKTIGIVTIYDPNPNYGNRLQNYAVQTVLENMGYSTVTYSFEKDYFNKKEFLKYIIQWMTGYHLPGDTLYWKNIPSKILRFRKFNKKYIKTKRITSLEEIDARDYYVIGSDQVWNASWYGNDDLRKNMYLLTFAAPEKRICFSPSFGVDQLPKEWESWFKKYLSEFRMLSVREAAGAKIIKDLLGKSATVLVDPTMMLSKEIWEKIEKKPPHIIKKDYVLTYFLSPKCDEADTLLKSLGTYNEVYELMNSEKNTLKGIGPSEFLWLFNHAKLILTDSFHACVFSFLFDKPFLVYDRNWKENSTNSRLETLLSKFDLERKYVNSGKKNSLLEHDYSNGYKQLELERKITMDYLRKALEDEYCG